MILKPLRPLTTTLALAAAVLVSGSAHVLGQCACPQGNKVKVSIKSSDFSEVDLTMPGAISATDGGRGPVVVYYLKEDVEYSLDPELMGDPPLDDIGQKLVVEFPHCSIEYRDEYDYDWLRGDSAKAYATWDCGVFTGIDSVGLRITANASDPDAVEAGLVRTKLHDPTTVWDPVAGQMIQTQPAASIAIRMGRVKVDGIYRSAGLWVVSGEIGSGLGDVASLRYHVISEPVQQPQPAVTFAGDVGNPGGPREFFGNAVVTTADGVTGTLTTLPAGGFQIVITHAGEAVGTYQFEAVAATDSHGAGTRFTHIEGSDVAHARSSMFAPTLTGDGAVSQVGEVTTESVTTPVDLGSYTTQRVASENNGAASTVLSSTVETYYQFPWGDELISTVSDPTPDPLDGSQNADDELQVRNYQYGTDPAEPESYGRLQAVFEDSQNGHGDWTIYGYGPGLTRTFRPWLSTPVTMSEPGVVVVPTGASDMPDGYMLTEIEETIVKGIDQNNWPKTDTTTTTTQYVKLGGVVYTLGRSSEIESEQRDFTEVWRRSVADPVAHPDPPNRYSRRDTETWHERFRDRVVESVTPTGATTTYQYEFVTIVDDGDPTNPPPDASIPDDDWFPEYGPNFRTIRTEGIVGGGNLAGQTTRTITVENDHGVWLVETRIWDGSAFELATVTEYVYDARGRPTAVYRDSRQVSATSYPSARITRRSDAAGVVTETEVDREGRTVRVTREGGDHNGMTLPTVTTNYEYAGLVTRTLRNGRQVFLRERDTLGRTVREIDETGRETTFAYTDFGRTVTETRPGGLQVATRTHPDGRLESVGGSPVVGAYYNYGVTDLGDTDGDGGSEGFIVTTSIEGWIRTRTHTTRWDGGIHQQSAPNPSDPTLPVVTTTHYDSTGRLLRISDTTGDADRLTAYPGPGGILGTYRLAGLDAAGDQSLDLASMDRVTASLRFFRKDADGWWSVSEARSHHLDSDGGAYRFSREASLLSQAAGERSISEAGVFDGTESIHQSRETSRSYDRAAGTVTTTTITAVRAGVDATASSVSAFGYVVEEAMPYGGIPATFRYDDHGRLVERTDARGALRRTVTNASGQVVTEIDALGKPTRYLYYPPDHPHAGLLRRVTNPAGETTEYSYTPRGEVASVSGTAEYPREFTYTATGELKSLTTHGAAGPAVTLWIRDPASGIVLHKVHNYVNTNPHQFLHPDDVDGKATSYSYHASGRLHERIWARTLPQSTTRLTTTYSYNPLGDLTGIAYNDGSTPDVTFANHDRSGQPRLVTQAGIGSATMSYDPTTAQLDTLAHDGAHTLLPGLTIDYHAPEFGRPKGYAVTDGTATLQNLDYFYDGQGRLEHIDSGPQRSSYAYHPGTASPRHTSTGLLASPEPFVRQTRHLDLAGRTTGVVTRSSDGTTAPQIATALGYEMDDADRRIRATRNDGTAWHYSYNPRGEVIGGSRRLHDGTFLAGQQFGYEYDAIGNRRKARFGGDVNGNQLREISYTSNELNQYTVIFDPGYVTVLGRAPATSTLETNVTLFRIDRQGDRFHAEFSGLNVRRPFWGNAEVIENGINTEGGGVWVPAPATNPIHDADGNLTSDSRWGYTWNGENRLVAMETLPSAVNFGAPYRKLLFTYDWQGRRIAKKVYDLDPVANPGATPITDRRFLYDGWNLTAEFEAPNTSNLTLKTSYTWGLDLSDTLQGAGGVGGLLRATAHGGTPTDFYPHYDGNGNIVAWSGNSGTVQQTIDYDPFGRVIARDGELAGGVAIPFAFSTKYEDGETGMNYYGYRYYEPVSGRWVSRDPIGEVGGFNLYSAVGNDLVGTYDVLGLQRDISALLNQLNQEQKVRATRKWLNEGQSKPLGHYLQEEIDKSSSGDGSDSRPSRLPRPQRDSENWKNGCECGKPYFRKLRKDNRGNPIGEWQLLPSHTPANIPRDAATKWQFRIEDSTCEEVKYRFYRTTQPEDRESKHKIDLSDGGRGHLVQQGTWDGRIVSVGGLQFQDRLASLFRPGGYTLPGKLPGEPNPVKKVRIMLRIWGLKKGKVCCVKTFEL